MRPIKQTSLHGKGASAARRVATVAGLLLGLLVLAPVAEATHYPPGFLCYDCHAVSSSNKIPGTKMLKVSTKATNLGITGSSTPIRCLFCHFDDGNYSVANDTEMLPADGHFDGSSSSYHPALYQSTFAQDSGSLDCLDCHTGMAGFSPDAGRPGNYNIHGVDASATNSTLKGSTLIGGSREAACTTCHDADGTDASGTNGYIAPRQHSYTSNITLNDQAGQDGNGAAPTSCATSGTGCHGFHDSQGSPALLVLQNDSGHNGAAATNASVQLTECDVCHTKDSNAASFQAFTDYGHGKAGIAMDCVSCHKTLHDDDGDDIFDAAPRLLASAPEDAVAGNSTFGTSFYSNCLNCHADIDIHTPTPTNGGDPVTTRSAGCIDCHDPHGTAAADATYVNDKMIRRSIEGESAYLPTGRGTAFSEWYDPTNLADTIGTCDNAACHTGITTNLVTDHTAGSGSLSHTNATLGDAGCGSGPGCHQSHKEIDNATGEEVEFGASNCTKCHNNGTDDGSVANAWPTTSSPYTGGAHGAHSTALGTVMEDPDGNGTAECETCHAFDHDGVATDVLATPLNETRPTWIDDMSAGAPAYAPGTGNDGTCADISCHGGLAAPAWNTTIAETTDTGCRACHTVGTTQTEYNSAYTGLHGRVGYTTGEDHTAVDATYNDNTDSNLCTHCHGVPSQHFDGIDTAALDALTDGDFVATFDGTGTGIQVSTGTCAVTCHKDNAKWGRIWSSTITQTDGGACPNCHGGPLAAPWTAGAGILVRPDMTAFSATLGPMTAGHAADWDGVGGDPQPNLVPADHDTCYNCHGLNRFDDPATGGTDEQYSHVNYIVDDDGAGPHNGRWPMDATDTAMHGNGQITMNGPSPEINAGNNASTGTVNAWYNGNDDGILEGSDFACGKSCHGDNTDHNMGDSGWAVQYAEFDSGAGLICNNCHTHPAYDYDPAPLTNHPLSGTHDIHVGVPAGAPVDPGQPKYAYSCITTCHITVNYAATHNQELLNELSPWPGSDISTNVQVRFDDTTLVLNPAAAANNPADQNLDTTDFGGGNDSTNICANTYCHGGETTPQGDGTFFPAADQGSNTAPDWTVTADGDCGTCHAMGGSTPLGFMAHPKHVDADAADGYNIGCQACHYEVTNDGSTVVMGSPPLLHVNREANVSYDSAGDARTHSTSTYAGNTLVGIGFGTCTNLYCHSRGTDFVAPFDNAGSQAANAAYSWSDVGSVTCGECHGDGATAAVPTYAHNAEFDTGFFKGNPHAKHSPYGCNDCHESVTNAAGDTIDTVANHVDMTLTVDGGGTHGTFTVTSADYTSAPGTGTVCDNTYCHGQGTDVTHPYDAQVATVSWKDTVGCGGCHGDGADAPVPTYAHNSTFDTDKVKGNPHAKHSPYGCNDCHETVTNAAGDTVESAANHANKVLTVDGGGTHGTFTVTAANYSVAPGTGVNCDNTYCHGQGVDITQPYSAQVAAVNWKDTVGCGGCHGDGANAAVPTYANPTTFDTDKSKPNAHGLHSAFGCDDCHSTMTNAAGNAITDPALHANRQMTVAGDFTVTVAADYSSAPGTPTSCNAGYCHSGGYDVNTPYDGSLTASWSDSIGCDDCHGDGAGSPAPSYADGLSFDGGKTKANAHAKHASAGCDECHGGYTNAAGTSYTGGAAHANGVINVFQGGSSTFTVTTAPDYSTGATATYCSTISCHGGGDAGWDETGTLSCDGCHYGAGDVSNWNPSDSTTSVIDSTEWTTRGHGVSGALPWQNASGGNSNPTTTFGRAMVCTDCHDATVDHGVSTNPFRLRTDINGGTNTVAPVKNVCLSTGCHAGEENVRVANHQSADSGKEHTTRCTDCHDVHGEVNGYMIRNDLRYVNDGTPNWMNSDQYGVPGDASSVNAVTFPGNTGDGGGTYNNGDDFASTTNDGTYTDGICETCHSSRITHFNNGIGGNTNVALSGHTATGSCVDSCHPHSAQFNLSGGGGHPATTGCIGCHTSATGAVRAIAAEFDGTLDSHHIQDSTGGAGLTNAQKNTACNICHFEDEANGQIKMRVWTTTAAGATNGPGGREVFNGTALIAGMNYYLWEWPADYGAPLPDDIDSDSDWRDEATAFCLGCHSADMDTIAPFGADPHTPRAKAWDGVAVGDKYPANTTRSWDSGGNTGNDPWSPYDSATHNVTPAKYIEKAYSAHGNVEDNHGGIALGAGNDPTARPLGEWQDRANGTGAGRGTNVRTGVSNVECVDCHNAHASDATSQRVWRINWDATPFNGVETTSGSASTGYTGGLAKHEIGGLLASQTGSGGASDSWHGAYTATAGSITNPDIDTTLRPGYQLNYSPEADLCWDCHLADADASALWPNGYADYGLDFGIMHHMDGTSRWVDWDTRTYSYKEPTGPGAGFSSIHFKTRVNSTYGMLTTATSPHGANRGQCTSCHDPHGVTTNQGPSFVQQGGQNAPMFPLLKGNWLTPPYKEDAKCCDTEYGLPDQPTDPIQRGTGNDAWPQRGVSLAAGQGLPRENPHLDYNNPAAVGEGFGTGISGTGYGAGGTGWPGFFIDQNTWQIDFTNKYWATNPTTGVTDTTGPTQANPGGPIGNGASYANHSGLCSVCHSNAQLRPGDSTGTPAVDFSTLDSIHNTVRGVTVSSNWPPHTPRVAAMVQVSKSLNKMWSKVDSRQNAYYPHGIGGGGFDPTNNTRVQADAGHALDNNTLVGIVTGSTENKNFWGWYPWPIDPDTYGAENPHSYSCSKCHRMHASPLPRLMRTNCLESSHLDVSRLNRNNRSPSLLSGETNAMVCHGEDYNNQWNTVTPWNSTPAPHGNNGVWIRQ